MAKKNDNFVPFVGDFYRDRNGTGRVLVFYVEGNQVKYSPERQSVEYITTVSDFVRDFEPADFISPEAESEMPTGEAGDDESHQANAEVVKQKRADKAGIEKVDDKDVPTDKVNEDTEAN
jgi:hypothetical protein